MGFGRTARERSFVYHAGTAVEGVGGTCGSRWVTLSYAGDAHLPKHSLEYSLNFWSQSKKKKHTCYRYMIQSSLCRPSVANNKPSVPTEWGHWPG